MLASQKLVGWGFWLLEQALLSPSASLLGLCGDPSPAATSLPLAWLVLMLPPASQPWGSLLWPHSLSLLLGSVLAGWELFLLPWPCSAARLWGSRGWHRAGRGSSACLRCAATPELLPGGDEPMACEGLMYSVGLSDVLSCSWGLFLSKKSFKNYFRSSARKWKSSPGEPGCCDPAAAEGGCDRAVTHQHWEDVGSGACMRGFQTS